MASTRGIRNDISNNQNDNIGPPIKATAQHVVSPLVKERQGTYTQPIHFRSSRQNVINDRTQETIHLRPLGGTMTIKCLISISLHLVYLSCFLFLTSGCEEVRDQLGAKLRTVVKPKSTEGGHCESTSECRHGLFCGESNKCIERGKDYYFEVKYSVKSQPGTERYSIEIAAPQDIVRRQEILELNITPKPSSQRRTKGSLVLTYDQSMPQSTKTIRVYGKARITGYDLRTAKAHDKPLEHSISRAFKRPSATIQSNHKEIRSQARLLKRKNDVETAKAVYRYVAHSMTYTKTVHRYRNRTALRALRTGKGVCYDYSLLFAALSRANGIPVRIASGITSGRSKSGHAWPEAYLSGYGWVAFDPTWDKSYDVSESTLPATRIAFKYSADGSSGLKWRYWGDEVDVDKWTVMEPWRERHDMNLRTDCGSQRARKPYGYSSEHWSRHQCMSQDEAGSGWSSCIPSYKYKSGAGRGCPGAQLCCPEFVNPTRERDLTRNHASTDCGSENIMPPANVTSDDWPKYSCSERASAGNRWPQCRGRSAYTAVPGRAAQALSVAVPLMPK